MLIAYSCSIFVHLFVCLFVFCISPCCLCLLLGQVYCSRCSTHRLPLEHLGFTQSVRVCDACHTKLTQQQNKGK